MLSALAGFSRTTLSGMLCASGRQFQDWSAAYRMFSRGRIDPCPIFGSVRETLLSLLPQDAPLVTALDDTLLRKTGRKIPGVSFYRDPLGPKFRINLCTAQRFVQLSGALPQQGSAGPCRMVPLVFQEAPKPRKPHHKATEDELLAYREQCREQTVGRVAVRELHTLRANLDGAAKLPGRRLICGVDGGYANKTVLRNLPANTTLIARIRKDAKLWELPAVGACAKGRPLSYGKVLPTPEALRQDEATPYQTVRVFAAGKEHEFRVKHIRQVKWRTAGEQAVMQLVVIAPLGYRPTQNHRLLYRQPAYLLCTDAEMDLQKILQYYVWRWEIEVNHREEKQNIGIGQAQVRNPNSTGRVPAFLVAGYAALLLAGALAYGPSGRSGQLPQPKWRQRTSHQRMSTADLISQLRLDLWGQQTPTLFSGFVNGMPPDTNPEKYNPHLASAVFYASTG